MLKIVLKKNFAYVSGHYKHFIKNRAKHAFLHVFVCHGRTKNNSSLFVLTGYSSYFSEQFDTMLISLSLLITEWASVEDKYPCVRAHVLHSIYGQKHAYKKYIGMNKDCQVFSSYLDWVWVGDMISCLIKALSIFLHNHIDLGTQNTNLHIMTSTYLRKMIVSLQILINFLLNFDML